jgi:hypothetical protein
MKETFGFNLNWITGYPGGAPIDAAMERGELTGSSRSIGPYVGREPFLTWHKKGFVRPLVQTGKERDRRVEGNVPTVWELAKELRRSKADIEFMETAFKGLDEWFWLYIAPPGMPPERARVLRDGFHKALNDSRLREEGAKIGLFPDLADPLAIQRQAAEVMNVDRKTVGARKKAPGPLSGRPPGIRPQRFFLRWADQVSALCRRPPISGSRRAESNPNGLSRSTVWRADRRWRSGRESSAPIPGSAEDSWLSAARCRRTDKRGPRCPGF